MIRHTSFLALTLLCLITITGCRTSRDTQPKPVDEATKNKKVEELLRQMTIEEKAGEMTQLSIDMISDGDPYNLKLPQTINKDKLHKAINEYHVGSILNVGTQAHTPEEWRTYITAIQNAAKENRLKIPVLYGIDAIHGPNYTAGSTLFPQQIGIAATWNRKLAEELAAISAYETRASAIPWTFSPVLDLGRNPVWPRIWEGFGEDVFLSAELGKATTRGFQGSNLVDKYKVAACLKHFTGYGMPISGRDRTTAWIPDRQLQEYYLPGFAAAIKEGAASIMICSGEINGIPVHADKHLLTDILRTQLGFKGVAVTDWEDIKYLYTRHHVAANEKEATLMAINAGIDMSMVPNDYSFTTTLIQLVKEGKISTTRIDESVRRILKMKMDLGLFDNAMYPMSDYKQFGSDDFREKSLQGAQECLVLLKNSNQVLPLPKKAKVLVTGPTANTMRSLNGGWSYTWQGDKSDEFAKNENTILEAIKNKIGKDKVDYVEGCSFDMPKNITAAIDAAKDADYIILCLGETSYTEFEGNINDLYMEEAQVQLADAMYKTGKPVILVLAEGRPRIISKFESRTNAILLAPLPGNQGGNAISDVLFGDVNPSGKLPITYPRYSNALMNYDRKYTEDLDNINVKYNPQFEFGSGLSYTHFEYKNLKLSSHELNSTGKITFSVEVKNTGNQKGKEVVQLYISDLVASITPSVKRLRGFDKIELKPGESKTVSFEIHPSDLAFVGIDNKWITEPGEFKVNIGGLMDSFYYK